jgi:geranylgeranyl reductase family protein
MNAETIKTDVLIVGAGPSGATASLFLAKLGIAHTIVDAAVFPRDKVCGDGLDLKVTRVLRHLDPAIVTHEVFENQYFTPNYGVRLLAPKGKIHDFQYDPAPVFWTAKRLHFDDFLVKKIDPRFADFRQGTDVEKIERDGRAWRVFARSADREIEIHTPLLLGADGDHSVVLRHLGERKIDRRHYAGSVRQYWRGVTGRHPKNLIEIYFPPGLTMAYFYLFPLSDDETNVGFGMVSEVAANGGHNLREIFKKLIETDPVLAPRFQNATPLEAPTGWGLPFASRRRQAFGDGYLLLGDAASLVCPISGEGIGTGMISGYIAAQFVDRALKTKDFGAAQFRNYHREIYRRLEADIWAYNAVMRVSPPYDLALRLAASTPVLRWSFDWRVAGWVRTAYEKQIEVNF